MAWVRAEGSFGTAGLDAHVEQLGPICSKSAVLVPVPEAEALVGPWRAMHDPKAAAGVPAHITLMFPWIPPEQIKPEHLEELDELFVAQPAFGYTLDRVKWFGERVLWLSPNPSEPFRALTTAVARHFDTQPWEGEFAEVIPHLTIGMADHAPETTMQEAAREIDEKLPLSCVAREVQVMCGYGTRWEVLHRALLREG